MGGGFPIQKNAQGEKEEREKEKKIEAAKVTEKRKEML